MSYAHSDYTLPGNIASSRNYGQLPPSANSYPPAPGLPVSAYMPAPGLPVYAYPPQTYYMANTAPQQFSAAPSYAPAPGYPVTTTTTPAYYGYAPTTNQAAPPPQRSSQINPTETYFSHEHLLQLVKEFAPNITHSGVCNGVTTTWAQASLTGDKQKQEFFDRFNFIKQNYVCGNQIDSRSLARDLDSALKRSADTRGRQPLTAHEMKLLDVRAFCETVALHQDPGSTNVFPASHTQHQRNEILPLTASIQQEGKLGKNNHLVANSIGTVALKQDAYAAYLADLQSLVTSEAAKGNKAVILHSLGNHVVGLSADPGTNKWQYFDINGKPLEYGLDSKQVSSYLHRNYGADSTGNYNMGEVSVVSTNGSREFIEAFNQVKEKHFRMPQEAQAKTDLLVIASMNGENTLVKQLITDAKVDPNAKSNHRSALGMAATHGQQSTAKLLIENGADPNVTHLAEPPLIHAIRGNQNKVAEEILVSKKTNPNAAELTTGDTALHLATKAGDTELVKAILANGRTNPDIPNSDGIAPLHQAVASGHHQIVGQLLANKANPTIKAQDSDGSSLTPLSIAVATGNTGMVSTLLENPTVKAELQSKAGQEILSMTPEENKMEIKKLLQAAITQPPSKNSDAKNTTALLTKAMPVTKEAGAAKPQQPLASTQATPVTPASQSNTTTSAPSNGLSHRNNARLELPTTNSSSGAPAASQSTPKKSR